MPVFLFFFVSRVKFLTFFISFEQFFDTPSTDSAAPQALGFEGFFRGAYSYHFHNFWYAILLIIYILLADFLTTSF